MYEGEAGFAGLTGLAGFKGLRGEEGEMGDTVGVFAVGAPAGNLLGLSVSVAEGRILGSLVGARVGCRVGSGEGEDVTTSAKLNSNNNGHHRIYSLHA